GLLLVLDFAHSQARVDGIREHVGIGVLTCSMQHDGRQQPYEGNIVTQSSFQLFDEPGRTRAFVPDESLFSDANRYEAHLRVGILELTLEYGLDLVAGHVVQRDQRLKPERPRGVVERRADRVDERWVMRAELPQREQRHLAHLQVGVVRGSSTERAARARGL